MRRLLPLILAVALSACASQAPKPPQPVPTPTPAPQPIPVPTPPAPQITCPARDTVLNSRVVFQGSTVHTQAFGDLPWFDAALWSPELDGDRPGIWAQKLASGDTAAMVLFYDGAILYDESGQVYQRMHTHDFEHHPDEFRSAVITTIQNGYIPWVYLQGDGGQDQWKNAYRQFPIAYQALANGPEGDLTRCVLWKPAFDGIFYGWPDDQHTIPGWAALIRQSCPLCNVGIEFNTGHIPLGNGPGDYNVGGLMSGYDVIDVEFLDSNIHGDATWQILGRLLGPQYARPPDQPGDDDPRPPCYTCTGNARGPYVINCLEWQTYEWVRNWTSPATIEQQRQYLQSVGCRVIG